MKNRYYRYFIMFSAVFYLIIILFAVFQLKFENDKNADKGRIIFEKIKNEAVSLYLTEIDFSSRQYQDKIKSYFYSDQNLEALIIADRNNVIQYFYAKNKNILAVAPVVTGNDIKFTGFRISPVIQTLLSDSIIIPGGKSLEINAVYRLIEINSITEIIKYLIIFVLFYIIVSVFFLLFLQDKKKVEISAKLENEPVKGDVDAGIIGSPVNPEPENYTDSGIDAYSTNDEEDNKSEDFSFNPGSGLVWYEYFYKRLSYELEKAGSFDNDLTLAIISYTADNNKGDEIIKNISKLISSVFISELAFEYRQKNSFAIIIPETQIEEGIAVVNSFIVRLKQITGLKNIYAGLSSKNSRIISGKVIIKEAEGALAKSLSEPDSPLIAFRSDPDKYRESLSKQAINPQHK